MKILLTIVLTSAAVIIIVFFLNIKTFNGFKQNDAKANEKD
jgi:hypothetical protein